MPRFNRHDPRPGTASAYSRRRILTAAGTLAVAGLCDVVLPSCSAPDDQPVTPLTAARSDALVDMVGVRTAMYYANTSLYGDVPLVLAALRDDASGLGIRHVREELILPSRNATMALNQRRSWPQIADLDIDFTCLIGAAPDDSDGSVDEFAGYIENDLADLVGRFVAVENANEPNDPTKPWNTNDPLAWVALCRARQEQMAALFRDNAVLEPLRLVGPSLGGGAGLLKYQELGSLAPNVDIGNFHYYSGNRDASVPAAELDEILEGVAINAPGKPVYCTETGMHQGVGTAMASHPESVAGIYMPRLVLEHFSRGVERVFLFELLDDHRDPSYTDQESHFGLLRYGRTLDPKPSYLSLKRLLDLLRDPGPSFTPTARSIQIDEAPSDYRQVLFQKRDGRHYLCMWRDVSIWDQVTGTPIEVSPVAVQVSLEQASTVKVFRPDSQTPPSETKQRINSTTIALAGEVRVLEIS